MEEWKGGIMEYCKIEIQVYLIRIYSHYSNIPLFQIFIQRIKRLDYTPKGDILTKN